MPIYKGLSGNIIKISIFTKWLRKVLWEICRTKPFINSCTVFSCKELNKNSILAYICIKFFIEKSKCFIKIFKQLIF